MRNRLKIMVLGVGVSALFCIACDDTERTPTASSRPDFFSQMTRVSEGFEASVLETLKVGQYSYARVRPEGAKEERWIVALQSLPTTARIRVRTFGQLSPFYSKRLERRFQTLDFAVISAATTGSQQ